MTSKLLTPVRLDLNLVAPLAHKATDMHATDTAAPALARSGAVAPLIGPSGHLQGDVDRANRRSTRPTTPGTRTSTTATRTPTTRTVSSVPFPSADSAPYSFDALVQAYLDCRRHKRNTASAQRFEAHLERNLVSLHAELCSGQYRPGRSICFVVTRPKVREVWAADFRDRIVHHLLHNQIAPRFIARFDAGSSACIPGRGTLYAAERVEAGLRSVSHNWSRPAWYLKMDLANFFVAIDKRVLLGQIARHVPEPWRRITRRRTLHQALQRLDATPAEQLLQSGNSYLGLVRQATHSHHDQALIARLLLDRGHSVAGDLSKIFRKST